MFDEAGAGTRVTLSAESNPLGPFKLLASLINRKGQRGDSLAWSAGVEVVSEPTLASARACYDRSAWGEACDAFARVDREAALAARNLEGWATAAYLAGRDDESTDAWSRAFDAHLAADDPERAVMCAFWSAFGLFQRGEMARGRLGRQRAPADR